MSPRAGAALGLIVAVALAGCGDEAAPCDLAALVPDLAAVPSGPRADIVAETLAIHCGAGLAADEALYASLSADLAAIVAIDPRMDISTYGPSGPEQVYPILDAFTSPPSLVARDAHVAGARATLDPSTCPGRLTAALHGTASAVGVDATDIVVEFAPRLHDARLIAAYAALGVTFEPLSEMVGDGSRIGYRDAVGGRDFLIELRGGDCPAGCTSSRSYWWQVRAGVATLHAEFDATDAPADLYPASFVCP